MAEQLVNEFTVNRPIDEAWPVITDVERIAPCLPGAQLTEIEGEVFRGIVKIKLGSIAPQFKGEAQFNERDDTAHHAVLSASGRDTGGRGNASATIVADAESLSPTSTRVVVSTDLHITGKVAQFGRGIIGDVSKKLMAQFANNLNTMLDDQQIGESDGDASGDGDDAGASPSSESADEAGSAEDDTPVAGAPVNAAAGDEGSAATTAGVSTDREDTAPKVRKIDSPASEPVDLAGVAGPAVLKRALPAAVVLLLVVILLRRRRS